MDTITKKKLIQQISQLKKMHPNDVRNIVQAFLDAMTDSLSQGDRLEKAVKFTPGKKMKQLIEKPAVVQNV
jgi:nucleoid DNA-binding protein